MKKRIVSLLIMCGMLAAVGSSALTVNAETAEIENSAAVVQTEESREVSGDYEYNVLSDGTVEITKYTGSGDNVKIPDKIAGKKVTRLGVMSFYSLKELKSVTIPNSVTSIGSLAFDSCKNLTKVTIPNSVKDIDGYAFSGTAWLDNFSDDFVIVGDSVLIAYKGNEKNVIIPNSVQTIGSNAFEECYDLTSVTIPNSVKKIGNEAFSVCSSLTNVTISNNVESIGHEAFKRCISLKKIKIPNSVKSIGGGAFESCSNLESINIPDSVTSIGLDAFRFCSRLKKVNLSKSIKTIPYAAFLDCCSLEDLQISEGVEVIDSHAFDSCSSLKNIDIPKSVKTINSDAFINCDSKQGMIEWEVYITTPGLSSVTVRNKSAEIAENAFPESITLYGYKDSTTETYAKDNNIKFVLINESDTPVTPNPTQNNIGDLDGDNKITSVDALYVLRASVGIEIFNANQNKLADVDGSGKVDSADSLYILRWSVGLKDNGILIKL